MKRLRVIYTVPGYGIEKLPQREFILRADEPNAVYLLKQPIPEPEFYGTTLHRLAALLRHMTILSGENRAHSTPKIISITEV